MRAVLKVLIDVIEWNSIGRLFHNLAVSGINDFLNDDVLFGEVCVRVRYEDFYLFPVALFRE